MDYARTFGAGIVARCNPAMGGSPTVPVIRAVRTPRYQGTTHPEVGTQPSQPIQMATGTIKLVGITRTIGDTSEVGMTVTIVVVGL